MGTYTINWPNWNAFTAAQGDKIMRVTVAECRITARRNVLVHKYPRRPGLGLSLGDSIYGTVRKTSNGYLGRVGSRLKYAASVEDGAERHIIRARAASLGRGLYQSGRFLHFFWYKRGYWVTTRSVNHPGQKGKHYLRNALIRTGQRRGFRVIIH